MKRRMILGVVMLTLAGFATDAEDLTPVVAGADQSAISVTKRSAKSGKHRKHHRKHRKQGGATRVASLAQSPRT
jgi:hypothetical protein